MNNYYLFAGCITNPIQMNFLNNMDACSQYFERQLFPRLRTELPRLDIAYTPGCHFAEVSFGTAKRYGGVKYNELFVYIKPSSGKFFSPVISGSLLLNGKVQWDRFSWSCLEELVGTIDELRQAPVGCKSCVLM